MYLNVNILISKYLNNLFDIKYVCVLFDKYE